MTVEELAKKLILLANKETLSKAEHEQAQQIMAELKKSGMSNAEIVKISGGRWKLPTVKGYTSGVKAPKKSDWQDAVSVLSGVISAGLSLEDIDAVLKVQTSLQHKGLAMEEVIELLVAADSASVEIDELVQLYKNASKNGLSFKTMSEAAKFKLDLEANGLTLDSLPAIVKLAKDYGAASKVLEALAAHGSLMQIESEAADAEKKRQDALAQVAAAEQELQVAEEKLGKLENALKELGQVKNLGFGDTELNSLAELAGKFGGPGAVFKALKLHGNLADLTDKVSAAKAKHDTLNAESSRLQTNNSHLSTAVSMCRKLISGYKVGPDGVATLLSIASKYGEPLTILRALEAYGSLKALKDKRAKLEGIIAERERLAAQMEGQYQVGLAHLDELNALAAKVGAGVGELEAKLAADENLWRIGQLLVNPQGVDFDRHAVVALGMSIALSRWASANEKKLPSAGTFKIGVEALVKDLGGA